MDLSTPIVMGIINVTPDSFYASSRINSEKEVLLKTEKMLNDGAKILDIGGYSSRPGAENITEEDEIRRIEPMISAISKEFPNATISIDTFRAKVAKVAIESGAKIINDISGFQINDEIIEIAKNYHVPYILMHMKGTPQNMMTNTDYTNLFGEVFSYFSKRIETLKNLGINDIILDPGFGFAKTSEQSHALLRNLESFNRFNLPILAGLSRKSMIYKKLNIKPEESLHGTIALNAIALNKGANILRVHDVKEAFELIKLLK